MRQYAIPLGVAAAVLIAGAAVLFGPWVLAGVFCGAMMVMMVWMMVGMAGGAMTKHRRR